MDKFLQSLLPNFSAAGFSIYLNQGNTVQMRWSAGEWIFRQMQMQIPKVYWR